MYGGKDLGFRFGVAYTLCFTAIVVAAALGVYGATHPKAQVTKKDVAAAVDAVAGDQNLYAMCEASVTQTVNQNYGQVRSLKHVTIKQGKTTKVTVALSSDVYTGNLTCEFTKSNWQLTGVTPG